METTERFSERFEQDAKWAIALGILMIILGILAIISPFFASLALEFFLGWLFIFAGIVQVIYAFRQNRGTGSLVLKLLLALLYLGVGILLITNPLAGILSLTLLVGVFFFVDGIFRVIWAFQVKPQSRWGWILFNGILMIILGILIWSQWPFNAPWVLGLLVGIGLLFNGIATLIYGTTAQELRRE